MFDENRVIPSEEDEMAYKKIEQEEVKKKKNILLAMVVGLGADEQNAREKIDWLLEMPKELGDIDCRKSFSELKKSDRKADKETLEKIIKIGELFLSPSAPSYSYKFGQSILRVVKEFPGDGSVAKLNKKMEELGFGDKDKTERFNGILNHDKATKNNNQ